MLNRLRAWLVRILFGEQLFQSIAVCRLQPGDVIVYRTDEVLTDRDREACIFHLQAHFPGHRVLVVDGGGELQLVGGVS